MRTLKLSTVAAICALGTVICFVLGAVAMASSGVGVLIPETGRPGRDWIAAVDGAGGLFFVGAWLVILMRFLGIVALVGFYGTLQWAGPVMILAPILGAVGLTLVTVSHLIPIAMSYELVPAYLAADPGRHATLAVTGGRLSRNSVIFRPPR
jgi:hypothetical protein